MQQPQKIAIRQDVDAVHAAAVLLRADDIRRAGREFVDEGSHGAQIPMPHARLRFDGDFAAVEYEINLQSAFGAPELDGVVLFPVTAGGEECLVWSPAGLAEPVRMNWLGARLRSTSCRT